MARVSPHRPGLDAYRTPLKQTPFHARTAAWNLNQSWIPWAGYLTAGTFEDDTMEYFALRNQAAVYDISPMVKYRITGKGAAAYLDRLQVRWIAKLKSGRVMYTAWCAGDMNLDGFVDDSDFVLFASAYNELDCASPTMPVGCPSDINNDGFVDDADFVLFADGYNNLVCP